MSSNSYGGVCPACDNGMDESSESRPFNHVNAQCLNCGFGHYPKVYQMDLDEINERRNDHNANMDLDEKDELKPLTQKDLDKWKKEIDSL